MKRKTLSMTIVSIVLMIVLFTTLSITPQRVKAFNGLYHKNATIPAFKDDGFADVDSIVIAIGGLLVDAYSGMPDLGLPYQKGPTPSEAAPFHFDNLFTLKDVQDYWTGLETAAKNILQTEQTDGSAGDVLLLTIGVIEHAAQDFYSHSNWIELWSNAGYAPSEVPTWDDVQNAAPGSKLANDSKTILPNVHTGSYNAPNALAGAETHGQLNKDSPNSTRGSQPWPGMTGTTLWSGSQDVLNRVAKAWESKMKKWLTPGTWNFLMTYRSQDLDFINKVYTELLQLQNLYKAAGTWDFSCDYSYSDVLKAYYAWGNVFSGEMEKVLDHFRTFRTNNPSTKYLTPVKPELPYFNITPGIHYNKCTGLPEFVDAETEKIELLAGYLPQGLELNWDPSAGVVGLSGSTSASLGTYNAVFEGLGMRTDVFVRLYVTVSVARAPIIDPTLGPAPIIFPFMGEIKYTFGPESDIFTALQMPVSQGGVNIIGYWLNYTQLTSLLNNTNICISTFGGNIWAYSTGMLDTNPFLMSCMKTNTINYTGPRASTPDSNIIYYGTGPPDMLNPIFSSTTKDYQVLNEIFANSIASNPYTTTEGSAITGVPAGGDLPWMAYSWKTETIPSPDPTDPSAIWTNVTLWFRNDIRWHDGYPFTVDDLNYTIYVNALYGDSLYNDASRSMADASKGYAPYFQKDPSPSDPTGDHTCSILVKSNILSSLYLPCYMEIVPKHLYQYIVPSDITATEEGLGTDGLHGIWPGQAATADNILPGAPFTLSDLKNNPETTLVGTGPWMYRPGSYMGGNGGGITLDANPSFFLKFAPGTIAFKYTWLNTSPSQQPSGGYFKIGLADLVYLANAYGRTGTPPSTVPISSTPGAAHTWNPAADLAAPSGVIGLSDLVTLGLHYGWYWGNYSYNAPYPVSEIANGGP